MFCLGLSYTLLVTHKTGKSKPTRIPEGSFSRTYIATNTSASFYITFVERVMIESAVLGLSTGSVLFQNTDLQFKIGVGKAYSFANTDQNRVFNGAIYYSEGTLSPTSAPSSVPTVSPSSKPSTKTSKPTPMATISPSLSIAPTNTYPGLSTTFSGDQNNFGNMFELVSREDIVIRAFDVHASAESEREVEIYYRNGVLGALRTPGAWTKISLEGLKVAGKGVYDYVLRCVQNVFTSWCFLKIKSILTCLFIVIICVICDALQVKELRLIYNRKVLLQYI